MSREFPAERGEMDEAAVRILVRNMRAGARAPQPVYSDCENCGTCDHAEYACPCRCHRRNRDSECPDCGANGPHEDNGAVGRSEAFCCRECGMHFDAIPF